MKRRHTLWTLLPFVTVLCLTTTSSSLVAQPRFGFHTSFAINSLESPRLASALEKYTNGNFDEGSRRISGALAADVEIHANVHLSLEVKYLTTEFSFHPDRAMPRANATWDFSLIPITLSVRYLTPFRIGPATPFVSLGGGYIFSTINLTSNYGLITQIQPPTASFPGMTNGSGGWAAEARAGFIFSIGKSLWLEGYADYGVSSSLRRVEMIDLETGFRAVDIDIRSFTIGVGFGWFFF